MNQRQKIRKPVSEIRKQISIFVPLSEWRIIRDEAIRRRQPMSDLCRGWMEPQLNGLRRRARPSQAAAGRERASRRS
ncbi:MAG TPA: hypothetical protein VML55_08560 [Planctomycetaceae bacterium]|nr:hypothetical protein [Planctomycetaceae bacterium]